mgnify:CR=1 FL=1
MSQWRLLLTRPAEDCAALAQSLAAAGVGSSCLPLLAIEPVTVEPRQRLLLEDLHGFQAIIVVSKPAARLLLEQLAENGYQQFAIVDDSMSDLSDLDFKQIG